MKKIYLPLACAFYFLFQVASFAQISVTFPYERAIFQRSNFNEASIYVAGYFSEPFTRIEARFIPLVFGEGEPAPNNGDWAVVQNNPSSGNFYGSLTVKGGWYKLEVRGIRDGQEPRQTSVEHVGVGEVFLVAGQSNATGGDGNPNGPGAQHDQVNSINFQNLSGGTISHYSDLQLPCPEFVHLDAEVKTAPFGNYAWCWGSFGDKLYEKLHVPVMIFNSGWASTDIDNWTDSIDPEATVISAFGYTFPKGLPFGHLRIALNNYIAQLGIRAVLWHQGESDNYREKPGDGTYNNYLTKIWELIDASRSKSGKNDLAWIIARASRFTVDGATRVSENVINAQNEVINNDGAYPHVYEGPATDDYYDSNYRLDQIHFTGNGLISLAGFWVDKIDDSFLNSSVPYAATPPPHVTVSGSGKMTFTAPDIPSVTYNWFMPDNCNLPISESQQLVEGPGIYQLKVIDDNKNTVLSAKLAASDVVFPVKWKYFRGVASDNLSATLQWATTEEVNASYFEVQRGIDAINFHPIQKVAASGNSNITNEYSFNDHLSEPSIYYYRLKQVDLDGSFTYTRIVELKVGLKVPIRIFPNPVSASLNIQSGTKLNSVEIVDALGIKNTYQPEAGYSTQLDMSKFPKGIYTILVNGESFKVVK